MVRGLPMMESSARITDVSDVIFDIVPFSKLMLCLKRSISCERKSKINFFVKANVLCVSNCIFICVRCKGREIRGR